MVSTIFKVRRKLQIASKTLAAEISRFLRFVSDSVFLAYAPPKPTRAVTQKLNTTKLPHRPP